MFLYEIFWGCGSIEIGLVKACSLTEATRKVRERAGKYACEVWELEDNNWDGDFAPLYES